MQQIQIRPPKRLKGTVVVPPDKSISHRAVIIGSIANGITRVENFLMAQDCLRTIDAFRAMGVEIQMTKARPQGSRLKGQRPGKRDVETACDLEIKGRGMHGLKRPCSALYLGNSGTTMRLLCGVLAGQDFETTLTGDESLSQRPMKRVTGPLRLMGAKVKARGVEDEDYLPLTIKGGCLEAIDYLSPIPSAQVKSCILLAGLYASGSTRVTESAKSRDHTERMLELFGAEVEVDGLSVSVKPSSDLKSAEFEMPADLSSAAYILVGSLLVKDSFLTIKSVGLNPTRSGSLEVLRAMGARIKLKGLKEEGLEPVGDIVTESSQLKGAAIEEDSIPRTIDELPVIMVAATQAQGLTVIKGAKELRVKETDRINSMITGLQKMGAHIYAKGDEIRIKGPCRLKGARVSSYADHRTAMALVIAGLCAEGQTVVEDTDCIATSFPNFEQTLSSVMAY